MNSKSQHHHDNIAIEFAEVASNFSTIINHDLPKIEQYCSMISKEFIDPIFLPSKLSLYACREGAIEDAQGKNDIVWKRPKDFFKAKYSLFDASIEPNDIRQGTLGDCWFMCSVACLAEFPELVQNMFVIEGKCQMVSEFGVYQVHLCKGGLWQYVTIDDYIPCSTNGGPIYCHSHGNELWVILLEKAYAKLHGSYAAISGGRPYEAMIDLTGDPYKYLRFDLEQEDFAQSVMDGSLWNQLTQWDAKGYILSVSSNGVDEYTASGTKPPGGLIPGHAYTLLSCVETKEDRLRLCKIRNPWGDTEWEGDWGDGSPLWTAALKEELSYVNLNDGIFWMSFEDLVRHFSGLDLCMSRHTQEEGWVEYRVPFQYHFSKQGNGLLYVPMYKFTITAASQDTYVTIHQPDTRILKSLPYLDVGVSILKFTDTPDKYEYVASSGVAVDRQNQLEAGQLLPESYLIVPFSSGAMISQQSNSPPTSAGDRSKYVRDAVLSIHSDVNFNIEELDFNPDVLEEAIEIPIIHDGKRFSLYSDESVVIYTKSNGYEGKSFVVQNNHSTDHYGVTFDFTYSKNLISHRGSQQEASSVEVIIPPMQAKVTHHVGPEKYELGSWLAKYEVNDRWLTPEEAQSYEQQAASTLTEELLAERRSILQFRRAHTPKAPAVSHVELSPNDSYPPLPPDESHEYHTSLPPASPSTTDVSTVLSSPVATRRSQKTLHYSRSDSSDSTDNSNLWSRVKKVYVFSNSSFITQIVFLYHDGQRRTFGVFEGGEEYEPFILQRSEVLVAFTGYERLTAQDIEDGEEIPTLTSFQLTTSYGRTSIWYGHRHHHHHDQQLQYRSKQGNPIAQLQVQLTNSFGLSVIAVVLQNGEHKRREAAGPSESGSVSKSSYSKRSFNTRSYF